MKIETCNNIIHKDAVNQALKNMPDEEILFELADFFKIFGDLTRIKILCSLFNSEMCVCDISATLSMTHSAVSHQLRLLKQARLIKSRKDGKVVYYSLNDDHIKTIFNMGLSHITE